MAEESLKSKTIKGVTWSGVDNVVQLGVTFVVSIILARLLSPDDYGLLGIIAIFTAVCNSIINGGFGAALIRKSDADNNDYNTAFIINILTSLILYILIFISAPYISIFFGRGELTLLTRISSLGFIIGAFAIVQQTILTKRIDFKTQTKITLLASSLSGIIGVGAALLGAGVWSLIAQLLSLQFFRTGFLWHFNKWRPQLIFSRDSFHNLFGFGWKIMISGLLDTIWKELYQVVVGKFYSPATLGQYTQSHQYSQLFSNNLTSVVQRVTYPVLSSIQDDKTRMVSAYRRIIKITMFITAVSMFLLGAIAEPLLYCMIGEKWHDAATYLPLICVAGSLYPLHSINLNMLQVQGRSDLYLGLEIAKKIIALVPLFFGAVVGIIPMLWANLFVGIISFFLNSHYSGKLLGYSSLAQLRDITPSYLVAIIMALAVYFFKFLNLSYWIILPIQLLCGLFVFFAICICWKLEEYDEIKSLVCTQLRKRVSH